MAYDGISCVVCGYGGDSDMGACGDDSFALCDSDGLSRLCRRDGAGCRGIKARDRRDFVAVAMAGHKERESGALPFFY